MEYLAYIEKDESGKILIMARLPKLLYNVSCQNTSSPLPKLLYSVPYQNTSSLIARILSGTLFNAN